MARRAQLRSGASRAIFLAPGKGPRRFGERPRRRRLLGAAALVASALALMLALNELPSTVAVVLGATAGVLVLGRLLWSVWGLR